MARSVGNPQPVQQQQPQQDQEAYQEALFQTARRVTTLIATFFVALASFATLPFEVALIVTLLSSVTIYNLTRLFPEDSPFVTVFRRTVVIEAPPPHLPWHRRVVRFFAPAYYGLHRHQVGNAPLHQAPPPLRPAVPAPSRDSQPRHAVGSAAASAILRPSPNAVPVLPPAPIVSAPSAPPPVAARQAVPAPSRDSQPRHAVGSAADPVRLPYDPWGPIDEQPLPAPSAPPLSAASASSAFARLASSPLSEVDAPLSRTSARLNLSPFPRPSTPRPSPQQPMRPPVDPRHAVGERRIPSHKPTQASYAARVVASAAAGLSQPEEEGDRPSVVRPTPERREAVGRRRRKK